MDKSELLEHLSLPSKTTNDEWMASLNERKLKELEFHNRDRDLKLIKNMAKDTYEQLHGNKKLYKTVQLSRTYTEKWINLT